MKNNTETGKTKPIDETLIPETLEEIKALIEEVKPALQNFLGLVKGPGLDTDHKIGILRDALDKLYEKDQKAAKELLSQPVHGNNLGGNVRSFIENKTGVNLSSELGDALDFYIGIRSRVQNKGLAEKAVSRTQNDRIGPISGSISSEVTAPDPSTSIKEVVPPVLPTEVTPPDPSTSAGVAKDLVGKHMRDNDARGLFGAVKRAIEDHDANKNANIKHAKNIYGQLPLNIRHKNNRGI